MKKLDVVIDHLHLNKLTEVLEKEGITGYTIIKDAIGKGERGIMAGDELTDVFKNSYLFTVGEDELIERILPKLEQLLKKYGGICIVSDVKAIGVKK